jgi:hypothetical protein
LVYINGGSEKLSGSHVSYYNDGDLLIGSNLSYCFTDEETGNKKETVYTNETRLLGNAFLKFRNDKY